MGDRMLAAVDEGLAVLGEVMPDDIVAHVSALSHDEAVALLRALLRARPDAAVEAVDTARVARPWLRTTRSWRRPLASVAKSLHTVRQDPWTEEWTAAAGRIRLATREECEAACDAAAKADGWVLAGGGK